MGAKGRKTTGLFALSRITDEFIDEYLRVNEDACGEKAGGGY